MEHKIDELLEKPCYVIDFLPHRVSPDADGQYFDVEEYLLNSSRHPELKDKFVNVILKLMCYYHISVFLNGWVDRPRPEAIEKAVTEILNNHSGRLNVLFPEENVLLALDCNCLYLAVYNLSESMAEVMGKIVSSEGLFLWQPEN